MKILIVDDEALVRRALRRAAEMRGHQVIEAADGDEGIKVWQSEKPDLVFLDVLMPKQTGPQVLQEMGLHHGAKVILISAYSGEYNLERAKNIGADLFISKPFENIVNVIISAESLHHG